MAFASQGRLARGQLYDWKRITWGNARFNAGLAFAIQSRNDQHVDLSNMETEAEQIVKGNPPCNMGLAFKI